MKFEAAEMEGEGMIVNDCEEYYAIPDCSPPHYTEEEKEQIRRYCEEKGIDVKRIRGMENG